MVKPKRSIKELFRTPPSSKERIGRIVRLDRNERTTPFPQEHFRKILNSIKPEEIVAYPELEPFYDKLSKWLKIGREQLLLVSGSDTGIRAIFEVYVENGDEVLIFPPTYGMYSVYCSMFGGIIKEVFYNDDFSLPWDKVLAAITPKTKLIIIANPNHTATALNQREIMEIIIAAKKNEALVLVDEAYYHFFDETMVPHINDFDNLIVVRTFSKAFGIAALRIGYLVSNRDIIDQLYKVKLTHEITSLSAKFGEYLLDNIAVMEAYVKEVKIGKEYLTKEFQRLGITVAKSETNFLFIKLPPQVNAASLVELLKSEDFYVSGPFSIVPVKGYIRITVGPMGQMQRFMNSFQSFYSVSIADSSI